MKLKQRGLLLILVLSVTTLSARAQLRAQKNWRDVEPETVTLLSKAKYQDTLSGKGRSRFSFKYGVRGEVAPEITQSQLVYGNINRNGDSDWLVVTLSTDDRSRVKDLGPLQWSEVRDVPLLPASVEPHKGFGLPARSNTTSATVEASSDGQATRPVAGHMYVVHARNSRTDLYALFRVEKLVPSDEVTISWKLVPAPKK